MGSQQKTKLLVPLLHCAHENLNSVLALKEIMGNSERIKLPIRYFILLKNIQPKSFTYIT